MLLAASIPISPHAKRHARSPGNGSKTPLIAALTDGEDFELLFTVASRDAVPLLDAWKKEFPNVALTCIGRITSEPGLKIKTERGVHELTAHGYAHFA